MFDLAPLNEAGDLGVMLFTIVAAAAGVIWRLAIMSRSFTDQGKRIGAVEERAAAHSAQIAQMESRDQAHEFKVAELNTQYGYMNGRLEQIMLNIQQQGQDRNNHDVKIEGRLASIETTLKMALEMGGLRARRQDQQNNP